MAEEQKEGLFSKLYKAGQTFLDDYIEKAQTNAGQDAAWHRKGLLHVDHGTQQQAGWIEKKGLVGPGVLKNMARKDSVIMSIINTRLSQISAFAKPQPDKYSPGFKIVPEEPAELTKEEKLALADPALNEETRAIKRYEILQDLAKRQEKEAKEVKEVLEFILHCGMPSSEMETDEKRCDFDKFVKLITMDTLTYNFSAIEKIPQKGHKKKDDWRLHHFYPVSSGGIRFISKRSAQYYHDYLQKKATESGDEFIKTPDEKFKYVQVLRGKVEAAWTSSEMVFEPRIPSIDPEDMGYAPGELESLIHIVTAHLYAEAHNRNFFTQGLGTKGLLHIKGESISQAQLESFKRQWFSQVVNTRNAFRPPIVGIADDVKWVPLAGNNKDMEFDNWMHYLIRIVCAVYQIDPAEINFDISKVNTSTLNESNNEQRIKSSRDKGLRPLLDYIENLINRHLIRSWNPELADKYKFKFVGLEAETRQQEADRLAKEVETWKTFNEARVEMGKEPLEHGDIVGNAIFSQYLAQLEMQEQAEQAQGMEEDTQNEAVDQSEEQVQELDEQDKARLDDLQSDLEGIHEDAKKEAEEEKKAKQKEQEMVGPRGGKYKVSESGKKESVKKDAKKTDKGSVKKAQPVKIEYYEIKEEDDEE